MITLLASREVRVEDNSWIEDVEGKRLMAIQFVCKGDTCKEA